MPRIKTSFIVSILLMLVFACNKQGDNFVGSDELIMGTADAVSIQSINQIIQADQLDNINLDIDLDGKIDFSIHAYDGTTSGAGSNKGVYITSVDENAFFHGTYQNDSIFNTSSLDSVIIEDEVYNKYYSQIRTCSPLTSSTAFYYLKSDVFQTTPLQASSELKKSDLFANGSCIWVGENTKQAEETTEINLDTTTYTSIIHVDPICNHLNLNEIIYIGIKMSTHEKLGWIKIELLSNTKVSIIEVAAQV
ncbi:hypothetical protein DNU06_11075 [Putridiphycobacter roseus]|uniref:Lipoprotein n=1 Tax=Putridiphycobacter roseus TaxID=2219161 RepID=A0A2W1N1H6_9FLAO|nr:hypothetical protein [Putridiphycobacter roseus]PZE16791.1 hypothetical protein DNU06_11075 [Putridiphycobacter roseus]